MYLVKYGKWICISVFPYLCEILGSHNIDEFDRVDISEGVGGMHDKDIFEAEEVMDKNNIYE